jgi:putative phage-type endonuclease
LFSSLRQCKPNAPINKLYQPSKFRPLEDNFSYKEHSVQSLPDIYIATDISDPMVPSREEIATEIETPVKEPALPSTVLHHCKSAKSVQNLCELIKRTPEEIQVIEESTKYQAKNELWHNYRKGIITASNAHRVKTAMVGMQAGKSPNVSNLLSTLLGKSFKGNKATDYGNKFEPVALRKFEDDMKKCHVNAKAKESGLYLHSVGFLGASPDGIFYCDCCEKSLIEIKCPYTLAASNPRYDFEKTSFLKKVGDNIKLNQNHKYYTQVQVQMGVTNIHKTHFIVWSPISYLHEIIEFDPNFWDHLFQNICLFFENFLGPYCIQMSACPNEQGASAFSDLDKKCGLCLTSLQFEMNSSILCECECGCEKLYHWSCVHYDPTEYEDLDCKWYCPTCVRNCDIVF